jgi:hypothetical protein
MNSNYIFTKRLMGMDRKVILTMLVMLLFSAGFLSYTIIKTNKETPCKPFDILVFGERNIENKTYAAGDQILFRAVAGINDKVTWDFGDNSPEVEDAATRHIFTEEKIFSITATINGKCYSDTKIHIKKKEIPDFDSSGNVVEQFILGESEAFVNEPVTFTAHSPVSSYRWSIDKSGYPAKTSKDATFTFKRSGIYTIRLMVNDDRTKEYKFTITVTAPKKLIDDEDQIIIPPNIKDEKISPVEKPPDDVEPNKKDDKGFPPSSDNSEMNNKIQAGNYAIQNKLQQYVCGTIKLQDLEPYFCYINNTPVIAIKAVERTLRSDKIEKIKTSVIDLYADLNCKKTGIQITSIEASRDNNNCVAVTSLILNYKEAKKACPNE